MGGAKPRATAPPVGAAGATDGAAGQLSSGRTVQISSGAAGGVAAGNVDGDGPNMNRSVAGATAGAAAAAGAANVDGAVPKENAGKVVAAGEVLLACREKPPDVPTLNVEALKLKENAGAVECGPDLRTIGDHRGGGDSVCTGAATQPHACAWEAWVASGGKSASIRLRARRGRAGGRAGGRGLVRRIGEGETFRRVVRSQEYRRT